MNIEGNFLDSKIHGGQILYFITLKLPV